MIAPGFGKLVSSSRKSVKLIDFSRSGSQMVPMILNWLLISLGSSLKPLYMPQTFIYFELILRLLIDLLPVLESAFSKRLLSSILSSWPTRIILLGWKLCITVLVSSSPLQGTEMLWKPVWSFSTSPLWKKLALPSSKSAFCFCSRSSSS
jgi:hypothetical protein